MTPSTPLQARYDRRGPVPQEVVEAVAFDLPRPQPGQALVEVVAAPVNPSDLLMLTGEYGRLPPLPAVAGNEGVGRVREVEGNVAGLVPGQLVLLPVGSGTWTTHMVVDARQLLPLPAGADPLQLSMLAVNPPTARLLLSEFVALQPGDWVLQDAANSAVGGYLVQLAAARGLRTVNVVRRESARAGVASIGGDVVLVDGDDLAACVREATAGADIRLGIDAVGGMATDRLAQSLAAGGTLVNYGMLGGEPCTISPAALVFRGIVLRGFWLAHWYRQAEPRARSALLAELAAMFAAGTLHARIQATFALDEVKGAVAAAAASGREGKILLLPNGADAARPA